MTIRLWSSARHRITRSTACPVTSPARPSARRGAARLKAKELREAEGLPRAATPHARRSFIEAAGASVVGGLGIRVHPLGVDAKKKNPKSSKFPGTERGLLS